MKSSLEGKQNISKRDETYQKEMKYSRKRWYILERDEIIHKEMKDFEEYEKIMRFQKY
jgi:hypothetical protein